MAQKERVYNCLPDVVTHPRKLTMFGCFSPSRDLPNSISCNSVSFSVSELLAVNGMLRSSQKQCYLNEITKQLTGHHSFN